MLLYVRCRRTTRLSNTPTGHLAEKHGEGIDRAATLGTNGQEYELEQPLGGVPNGKEARELPTKHGVVEVGSLSSRKRRSVESRPEMPANEEVDRSVQGLGVSH